MKDVTLLIRNKVAEINTVSDIAYLLNVSPETLRKKFLRNEKVHLGDYIMWCKVRMMREYLFVWCNLPCYTICYHVGLREDTGAKLFKRMVGLTMLGFREKTRKEFNMLNDKTDRERYILQVLNWEVSAVVKNSVNEKPNHSRVVSLKPSIVGRLQIQKSI